MRRVKTAGLVMLLSSFPAWTQSPVNFTGTWKTDQARSESAHRAVPIGPITLEISHNPTDISIETKTSVADRSSVANEKLVFQLDGSETTTVTNSGPVACKARWEGSDLIADTARTINGKTVTTSWVLRMDPSGKEIKVRKTLTIHHGYESAQAGNVGSETDTFVKAEAKKP